MKATLPQHIKLEEREHVEKPLLDQLAGLGWEVIEALLHESELARIDPDPRLLHRPMRYDIGLPSPVM